MTENNPIELKSDDPFAKFLAGEKIEETTSEEQKLAEENKEEEKKPEEQAATEEKVEVDFNQLLKEKTGGKFSSLDELENHKPEKLKVDIPEFKDDIEKLMWAASQKNDYSKISEIVNLNPKVVDNISDLEAVRAKVKAEMPGLSDADIEDEIFEKYGLGYKPLTEEQKEELTSAQIAQHEKDMSRFARQLKNDAAVKREAIKSEINSKKQELLDGYKDLFEVKEEKVEEKVEEKKPVEQENQLSAEQMAQMQRDFETEVSKQVKEVSTFKLIEKVPVSETEEIDVNIDYELSADEAKQLTDFIANYELTPAEDAKYVKRDGTKVEVDLKGLIQDKAKMLFSANFQKVLVKEAVTKAKEHVIKTDLKRVNLTPESITDRTENLSDKAKKQADFMTQWANGIKVQGT